MTTCNASEMFPVPNALTQSVFGFAIDYGMQALQVDFGIRHEIDETNHNFAAGFTTIYLLT